MNIKIKEKSSEVCGRSDDGALGWFGVTKKGERMSMWGHDVEVSSYRNGNTIFI